MLEVLIMIPDISIRPEHPDDRAEVYQVIAGAFPTTAEAFLVERLRFALQDRVSLVAESEDEIVGHILFTPVTIHDGAFSRAAVALGPMGVLPGYQRQEIGSRLITAGLQACKEHGDTLVFVLGHPTFYQRFGFEPAAAKGLRYKDESYDPYFFVLELQEGSLEGNRGMVEYHPEFDKLESATDVE